MDITNPYSQAADQIVTFHFGLVATIILYQLAIPAGVWWNSWWAKNFWIRGAHLGLMAFIGIEGALGIECPLTVWERGLRLAQMDDDTRTSYFAWEYDPMDTRPALAQFSHRALLYRLEEGTFSAIGVSNSTFFNGVHILFGILVVVSWIMSPPNYPNFLTNRFKNQTVPRKGNHL